MATTSKLLLLAGLILVSSAAIFLALQKGHQGVVINGKEYDVKSVTRTSSTTIANEPERVAIGFYRYYLTNVYEHNDQSSSPTIKLVGGVYTIDPTSYSEFLAASGHFSPTFYRSQLSKFDACNTALKAVSVTEVTTSGGSPTDFVNGTACGLLTSNQWVGGQGESLDTANVTSSSINGSTAEVTIVIGEKLDGTYSYNYSYPVVTLVKENDQWKISNITVSFTRPS